MKTKFNAVLSLLTTVCIVATLCACSQHEKRESLPMITEATTTEAPTTEPPEKKVEKILSDMTVEEKVGQLFFARCPDVNAVEAVSQYHLGGYILFGQDFFNKTKDDVVSAIKSYQDASKIPMLIGTDEEGGDVVRVSDNMYFSDTPFASPKNYYLNGGWDAVETAETTKAKLLYSIGVNVNLAPVCDVVSDPAAFMYSRSFSDNADDVSTFVTKTVQIYGNNHIGSVLKHFPGYGNNVDTHTGVAVDERELSALQQTDLKPFEAGINKGADCIMVSHNIVNCMDKEYPASLSAPVHKYIRDTMKFNGVIITDDLVMEAITQYTGSDTSAVFAVKSGNDMLCCSDLETQYTAVLNAVQNGEITGERLDESVTRILLWKQKLGLINQEQNDN